MLTAKEAAELTAKSKKQLNGLLESISAMAKSGNNSAMWENSVIDLDCLKELENLGYKVDITEKYTTASW